MRRFNPRRVKIHRSYSVSEVAKLCGAHKNTVWAWLKSGLKQIDQRRPVLIQGRQLAGFLQTRRERKRQPCRPGELYCFRCRMPKTAAGKADYLPITGIAGNLKAICPDCGTRMYRRVSLRKLAAAKMAASAGLRIYTIGVGAEAQQSIFGTSGNTDLDEGTLKSIARITGGEYYRATDASALQKVYARIDKLEPSAGREQWYRPHSEWFIWPLALALLLSIPAVLMRERI